MSAQKTSASADIQAAASSNRAWKNLPEFVALRDVGWHARDFVDGSSLRLVELLLCPPPDIQARLLAELTDCATPAAVSLDLGLLNAAMFAGAAADLPVSGSDWGTRYARACRFLHNLRVNDADDNDSGDDDKNSNDKNSNDSDDENSNDKNSNDSGDDSGDDDSNDSEVSSNDPEEYAAPCAHYDDDEDSDEPIACWDSTEIGSLYKVMERAQAFPSSALTPASPQAVAQLLPYRCAVLLERVAANSLFTFVERNKFPDGLVVEGDRRAKTARMRNFVPKAAPRKASEVPEGTVVRRTSAVPDGTVVRRTSEKWLRLRPAAAEYVARFCRPRDRLAAFILAVDADAPAAVEILAGRGLNIARAARLSGAVRVAAMHEHGGILEMLAKFLSPEELITVARIRSYPAAVSRMQPEEPFWVSQYGPVGGFCTYAAHCGNMAALDFFLPRIAAVTRAAANADTVHQLGDPAQRRMQACSSLAQFAWDVLWNMLDRPEIDIERVAATVWDICAMTADFRRQAIAWGAAAVRCGHAAALRALAARVNPVWLCLSAYCYGYSSRAVAEVFEDVFGRIYSDGWAGACNNFALGLGVSQELGGKLAKVFANFSASNHIFAFAAALGDADLLDYCLRARDGRISRHAVCAAIVIAAANNNTAALAWFDHQGHLASFWKTPRVLRLALFSRHTGVYKALAAAGCSRTAAAAAVADLPHCVDKVRCMRWAGER